MMSFFDKLKNSIGVEETEQKTGQKEQTLKAEKKSSKETKIHIKGAQKEAQNQEWFQPEGELAVDVFQTNDAIFIQSTIAGVKPDELDLSIENDTVTLSGERKNPSVIANEQNEEEKSYYYQECYWGPFSRQIVLPEEVDFNEAEATMENGIFTLRIPKMNRQKLRKIKVRG